MPIFVSGKSSVLFVHVPKCGGTSIEFALQSSGFKMHFFDGGGDGSVNPYLKSSPQHWHASIIRSVFNLSAFSYIFMVVRDPVARVKSEFIMRNRHESADTLKTESYFSDWLQATFSRCSDNPYALDNHMRPQIDFYLNGASIYKIEDGLERILKGVGEAVGHSVKSQEIKLLSAERQAGLRSSDIKVSIKDKERIHRYYAEDYRFFGYAMS